MGEPNKDYKEVFADEELTYDQIYKVLHKSGYRMDKALRQFVPRYAEQTEAAATTVEQKEEEIVVAPDTVAPTLTALEIEQLRALFAKANPISFERHIKDYAAQKFSATTVRVREDV